MRTGGAKAHGLGPLQVGVAGDDGVAVLFCLVEYGVGGGGELRLEGREGALQVQANIEGDLVVAAAPGVDHAPHISQTLGKDRLDEGVNVLRTGIDGEGPRLEFGAHGFKLAVDGRGGLLRNDAWRQHAGMDAAAGMSSRPCAGHH